MARAQRGGSARPLLLTALLGGIAILSLINWHVYSTVVDISPLTPPTRQVDGKDEGHRACHTARRQAPHRLRGDRAAPAV
jgi:hypothetical protein